jgi:glycosyltransferase involved in cell wall biosynthesis
MDAHSELVSVVTPCYNAAPFVGETLAAVRAQRYPHLEHLVVDDASTDASWHVVERHRAELAAAVRLARNRGGSHARNVGASLARGRYLMFLDADDLIAPDTITALVAVLQAAPGGADVAVCRWQRLEERSDRWIARPASVPFPPPADPLRGWLEGVWVPPCGVLWRREAFERTGGWDERVTLNDDGDLMMRALAAGARLVAASAGCAYYRFHGSSRTSVSSQAQRSDRLGSLQRALENLEAELRLRGTLSRYADAIGVAYHRAALAGFQIGADEFARECQRRGDLLAGRRAVSPTRGGRLLTLLLGSVERKERIADGLARIGIATVARKRIHRLRALHDASAGSSGGADSGSAAAPGIAQECVP